MVPPTLPTFLLDLCVQSPAPPSRLTEHPQQDGGEVRTEALTPPPNCPKAASSSRTNPASLTAGSPANHASPCQVGQGLMGSTAFSGERDGARGEQIAVQVPAPHQVPPSQLSPKLQRSPRPIPKRGTLPSKPHESTGALRLHR